MKLRPTKRTPKPTRISLTSFTFSLFANSIIKAPIPINRGAKNSGLSMEPHSLMDTSHAVIVVPILAPMITPTACTSVIRPAFTKPTTITVVAELLCIIAVTPAPTRIPISRFRVRNSSRCFILSPADFCRPSAMTFIPYKNIPRPPAKRNSISICSMIFLPL